MKTAVLVTFLLILTGWTALTAIRIERLNAQAGYYLPRQDGGADGKWRTSLQRTPRDQLRGLVISDGLLQYLLAPAVLVLGLSVAAHARYAGLRIIGVACCLVALSCFGLAFYRGYFTSLGW